MSINGHSIDSLMNGSSRIINAVNNIPYSITYNEKGTTDEDRWTIDNRRGNSALYSSINYMSSIHSTILLGWTGEIKNCHSLSTSQQEELSKKLHPLELVFTFDKDCRKYPEQVLWPLFHYILLNELSDGQKEKTWWNKYIHFNHLFAERTKQIYKEGDLIIVHDYHLLLLPQMIKQAIPSAKVLLFLHAPFPSSEHFKCLPKRKEILAGMLGANMLAFQSYSYSRHFVSSCARVLGFETSAEGIDAYGAEIAIRVLPIGIDADRVERECRTNLIDERIVRIKDTFGDKKIIIGRDRLDAVRGVLQKLQGFEKFLESYPAWRGRVVLFQVTTPAMAPAQKTKHDVEDLVAKINGKYGTLDYSPVHHYHHPIDQDDYFALLRCADVGLITSVRDAINVTGLEYIVCQRKHNGPVILSEFTGTSQSLPHAILINPWNPPQVASAINDALQMSPDEREQRQEAMYSAVTTNTVQSWVDKLLVQFQTVLASADQARATPVLDHAYFLESYNDSKKRLFMFDYDGTLTPIVNDPASAIPTDRILRTLKLLTQDKMNTVWIISGRDQQFLSEWLGDISGLGLSAEHGSFMRQPHSSEWISLIDGLDMTWQKDVMEIFQHYTEKTLGSFIERKRCALTWHYRRADPEHGATHARELQAHLEDTVAKKYDCEVMIGKMNIEVRPTTINKGEIVRKLLAEYGDSPPGFVFCAGDDKTDEDMFRQLNQIPAHKAYFSVTIGASSKMTEAKYHLTDPKKVIDVCGLLVGTVSKADYGVTDVKAKV